MKIGYARVSTEDQTPLLQTDALKKAGCTKTYIDHGVSGAVAKRPQLERCIKALKAGDTLVVWKLDRLGRSLAHLIALIEDLRSSHDALARAHAFVLVDVDLDHRNFPGC